MIDTNSIVDAELRDVICLFPLYFPFSENANTLDSLGSSLTCHFSSFDSELCLFSFLRKNNNY